MTNAFPVSFIETGLPDGLFSKPKIPIWVNFGGPWKENVGIFYDHLEY
jgi:hypothetical protein